MQIGDVCIAGLHNLLRQITGTISHRTIRDDRSVAVHGIEERKIRSAGFNTHGSLQVTDGILFLLAHIQDQRRGLRSIGQPGGKRVRAKLADLREIRRDHSIYHLPRLFLPASKRAGHQTEAHQPHEESSVFHTFHHQKRSGPGTPAQPESTANPITVRRNMARTPATSNFTAPLQRLSDGMLHHYLEIPPEIARGYDEAGIKRVLVELNGIEYRRAIQNKQDGRRIIVLGKDILKEGNLTLNELIDVVIQPDPEPDFVDMGEELTEVLAQDDEARKRWDSFSIGRQRSLAMYVTGAKTVDTRIKRALDLAEKLRTYTLYGDLKKE